MQEQRRVDRMATECQEAVASKIRAARAEEERIALAVRMFDASVPADEKDALQGRVRELEGVVRSESKRAEQIERALSLRSEWPKSCEAFLALYAEQRAQVPVVDPDEGKIKLRPQDLGRIPSVASDLGPIPVITLDEPVIIPPYEPGSTTRMKDKGRGGRKRREEQERERAEAILGPKTTEAPPPPRPEEPPQAPGGPPLPTRFRSLPERYMRDVPITPYGANTLGFERRSAYKPSCEAVASHHEGQAKRPSTILFELRKLGLKHRTAINCLDRMTGNFGKPWMVK
jgi:hypothetical protein